MYQNLTYLSFISYNRRSTGAGSFRAALRQRREPQDTLYIFCYIVFYIFYIVHN